MHESLSSPPHSMPSQSAPQLALLVAVHSSPGRKRPLFEGNTPNTWNVVKPVLGERLTSERIDARHTSGCIPAWKRRSVLVYTYIYI